MEIDTPINIDLYPPTKSNLIVFTIRNIESEIAPGFDDRLLQTLKSDISGVIGRVAR